MASDVDADPTWYFEEFRVGSVYTSRARTVVESDLTAFVGLAGFFEETFLIAPGDRPRMLPGVLVLSISEGLYVLSGRMRQGEALLGFEAMDFVAPVACGDTIRVTVRIVELTRSRSGRHGIVVADHQVHSDDNRAVLRYRSRRLVKARSRTEDPPRTTSDL